MASSALVCFSAVLLVICSVLRSHAGIYVANFDWEPTLWIAMEENESWYIDDDLLGSSYNGDDWCIDGYEQSMDEKDEVYVYVAEDDSDYFVFNGIENNIDFYVYWWFTSNYHEESLTNAVDFFGTQVYADEGVFGDWRPFIKADITRLGASTTGDQRYRWFCVILDRDLDEDSWCSNINGSFLSILADLEPALTFRDDGEPGWVTGLHPIGRELKRSRSINGPEDDNWYLYCYWQDSREAKCGETEEIENGQIVRVTDSTFVAQVVCSPGYVVNSTVPVNSWGYGNADVAWCNLGQQWDTYAECVKGCSSGKVSSQMYMYAYTNDDRYPNGALFCDNDYIINGDGTAVCDTSEPDQTYWDIGSNFCAKPCYSGPIEGQNMYISTQYEYDSDTSGEVTCAPGYVIVGDGLATCDQSNPDEPQWNYGSNVCAKVCPSGEIEEENMYVYTRYDTHPNGTLVCAEGYALEGDGKAVCDLSTPHKPSWDFGSNFCAKACASKKIDRENMYIFASNTTYPNGTVICEDGYGVEGNGEALCDSTKPNKPFWNYGTNVCLKNVCKKESTEECKCGGESALAPLFCQLETVLGMVNI